MLHFVSHYKQIMEKIFIYVLILIYNDCMQHRVELKRPQIQLETAKALKTMIQESKDKL